MLPLNKNKKSYENVLHVKNIMKKNIFNHFNNNSFIFKQLKAAGYTSILSTVFKGRQF